MMAVTLQSSVVERSPTCGRLVTCTLRAFAGCMGGVYAVVKRGARYQMLSLRVCVGVCVCMIHIEHPQPRHEPG